MRKSVEDEAAGVYEDWIEDSTELYGELTVMCHECHSYITHAPYWYINEEVLCDDCARSKYQRTAEGIFDV